MDLLIINSVNWIKFYNQKMHGQIYYKWDIEFSDPNNYYKVLYYP